MRFTRRELWIVAVAFFNVFLTIGLISSSFTAFFPFLQVEQGLNNAQLTSLSSARCLATLVTFFSIDRYYRRLGLRKGLLCALLIIAVSFWGFSAARGYPALLACAALAGVGYGLGGLFPATLLIDAEIHHDRGIALGIATAGSGIAVVSVPPLVALLERLVGIYRVFVLMGAAIAVLAVLAWLVLRRNCPGDAAPEETRDPARPAPAGSVLLVPFLVGGLCLVGWSNIPMTFVTAGYSRTQAELLFSVTGIVLTFAKLAYGRAVDRLGGRVTGLVFSGFLMGGMACACIATVRLPVFTGLAVVLLGLGAPVASVGFASWTRDWAPGTSAALLKQFQIVYTTGGLVLAPITGWLADLSGSYSLTCGIFAGFAALLLFLVRLHYRR